MHLQKKTFFLTETGLTTSIICQQQRPMLSPRYGTVPHENQLAPLRQVAYFGLLPSLKDQ